MQKEVILTVENMMCGHCKEKVEKALSTLENVLSVNVNLQEKTATVKYFDNFDVEKASETISNLGFEITNVQ